jgi:acyl-CoA synthetase (AMP-forming)/AMP-acid ligase II
MGQEIRAFVVLCKGSALDEKQLRNFLADRLASYKLPRFIEILPELPKSSNGKILRRQLPD